MADLYDLTAESAVLGAILLNNNAYEIARDSVGEGDFFAPAHQAMWRLASDKILRGHLADCLTLSEAVQQDEDLKAVGGLEYLVRLVENAAYGPEVTDYARLVSDFARRRALKDAGEILAKSVQSTSAKDALVEHDAAVEAVRTQFITKVRASQSLAERGLSALRSRDERAKSVIPSGYPAIDRKTGGFERGKLSFIAARPGVGKTAISLCVARHMNVDGHSVGFNQLEMDAEDMALRYAVYGAWQSGEKVDPYSDVAHGRSHPEVDAALERILRQDVSQNFLVNDEPGKTPTDIDFQIRAWKRRIEAKGAPPLAAVFVDHVGLLRSVRSNNSAYERVSNVSNELLEVAKRHPDLALIAICQLNRGNDRERRRPNKHDLRDSGRLEEDANAIYMLHREDQYYEDAWKDPKLSEQERADAQREYLKVKGQAEVRIVKCRHGEIGTAEIKHNIAMNVFRDPAWLEREKAA